MKKLLAIILSVAMLASICCINASATETTVTSKEKLNKLIECHDIQYGLLGRSALYDESSAVRVYNNALVVYQSESSMDHSYLSSCSALINANLNNNIIYEYAQATYEMAQEEQNYNNWYSDEEWSKFQNSIENLGNALDECVTTSDNLTDAFHEVLKSYNEMTNAYTLKGDLNKDGAVNVNDVTLLQKYLIEKENFTGAQKMLAGAKEYENPDIDDATVIQKYIVGLISEMPDNDVFISDLDSYSYMDSELLMERTINFNICSRTCLGVGTKSYISNGYSGIEFLYGYYQWCDNNGVEP